MGHGFGLNALFPPRKEGAPRALKRK